MIVLRSWWEVFFLDFVLLLFVELGVIFFVVLVCFWLCNSCFVVRDDIVDVILGSVLVFLVLLKISFGLWWCVEFRVVDKLCFIL